MASVSWDKTLRIWDAIEKGSAHETVELLSDGLCVAFKPNGQEVAVATLDGQIVIFDVKTASQLKSIEGRNDLGSGRSDTDLITAKKTLQAKYDNCNKTIEVEIKITISELLQACVIPPTGSFFWRVANQRTSAYTTLPSL